MIARRSAPTATSDSSALPDMPRRYRFMFMLWRDPFITTVYMALGWRPCLNHACLTLMASHGKMTGHRREAEVAELADAPDSKSGSPWGVWVRVPPSVLSRTTLYHGSRSSHDMGSRRSTPEGRRKARRIGWAMMLFGGMLILVGIAYVLF